MIIFRHLSVYCNKFVVVYLYDNSFIVSTQYIMVMSLYLESTSCAFLRCFYIIIIIIIIIILSLTKVCFKPAHTSTPEGTYNACCHHRRLTLLRHTAITSCRVLTSSWENQSLMTALTLRSFEPVTLQLRVLRSN